MPTRLVIDALDFAHNAGEHHGKIALSELERLQDYLVGNCGDLKYIVSGALDNAKPILRVFVQGAINLRCQRCLGELRHVLDFQTNLLLTKNEDELARLDEYESADGILAKSDMDVLALIEDEIILGLPISPRHGEGECSMGTLSCSDTAGVKPLFAALAQLKNLH
ncbi:MAG: YceD family protein [Pseudomonadota bacterium]|nr:YceD family protein [Pseudomonadota bacterium]